MVLLTATSLTERGSRPAALHAASIRALTACKFAAIVDIIRRTGEARKKTRKGEPNHPLITLPRASRWKGNYSGYLRTARVRGQEQGVRPAPVLGSAADDPRARRHPANQSAAD